MNDNTRCNASRKMHVMVDIETMSTDPRAAIISIGACAFDNTGIQHTFKVNIKPESAKGVGMVISKDTAEWWAKQPPESRALVLSNNVNADYGITQFVDWYNRVNPSYVWSNGVQFDITILEYAMRCVGAQCPWKFWQVCDSRTIFTMFGINVKDLHATAKTTAHDALGDATVQANAVIELLKALRWNESDSPLKFNDIA